MSRPGCFAVTVAIVGAFLVVVCAVTFSSNNSKASAPDDLTIARTCYGHYRGQIKISRFGEKYISYQGIAYAYPPTGANRFKRPMPLNKTHRRHTQNANTFKSSCWSVTKTATSRYYNEDCLYLNVYVPYSTRMAHFPVMVWIFGGGFVAGAPTADASKLVTRGNVIVVTIGYRLGVFGFLTNMDDKLPGNNGLYDQYMALKWVKENIRSFKGDDNSITIFGESAGASSVALHVLSPLSSGLFHKAIMQSGSASTLVTRDAKKRTSEFSDLVNCSHSVTPIQLANCLRQVSIADILANDLPHSFNLTSARQQADFIWTPVIDNEFIPDNPIKLLKNITYLKAVGAFSKDYFIGVLNDEGALVPENFLNKIPLSTLKNGRFVNDFIDYFCHQKYNLNTNNTKEREFKKRLLEFYTTNDSNVDLEPFDVLDLFSDALFVVPALQTSISLSKCSNTSRQNSSCSVRSNTECPTKSGKTFFYHIDYCPEKEAGAAPCFTHGSDVALVFPKNNFTDPFMKNLSDMLVDLLSNFARSSNPGDVVACGWPEFDQEKQFYLRIGPVPSVRQFPYRHRVQFWRKVLEPLIESK